jgi:hypothetical protein
VLAVMRVMAVVATLWGSRTHAQQEVPYDRPGLRMGCRGDPVGDIGTDRGAGSGTGADVPGGRRGGGARGDPVNAARSGVAGERSDRRRRTMICDRCGWFIPTDCTCRRDIGADAAAQLKLAVELRHVQAVAQARASGWVVDRLPDGRPTVAAITRSETPGRSTGTSLRWTA